MIQEVKAASGTLVALNGNYRRRQLEAELAEIQARQRAAASVVGSYLQALPNKEFWELAEHICKNAEDRKDVKGNLALIFLHAEARRRKNHKQRGLNKRLAAALEKE